MTEQHNSDKYHPIPVTFSRTLGVWEVTLLGVGALLGGGIFTLLGHTAGIAGGGLVFAMLIGAAISFLNLNAYVSLATTFPEVGGGYLWVRDGLGDLQGFLSGWISWMAHSVACSLYAVSFGVFAYEFIFSILGVPVFGFSSVAWSLIFTSTVVLIFGVVNYRGAALTGKVGGVISLGTLSILVFYLIFGFKRIIGDPTLLSANFSPLLPFGVLGVLQAASLFYIAFEGSEIQAQTGEEARDPKRTLKRSLFFSWGIITMLYVAVSFVIVGATDGGGSSSWRFLDAHTDRAIIESAKQFLPLGHLLLVVGGLFANLAALNATIYSSSRVLFAMARDHAVWAKLGVMHAINQTPYRAVVLSTAVIIGVALLLPLKDIAGAADILFVALFLQLNLAYIELRRKKPEAKWYYVVPLGPLLPLCAVGAYLLLGTSLFHISPVGIYFAVFWLVLGFVNYFGYTKVQEREELQREVMYEHATRFRSKQNYLVTLPVTAGTHWQALSNIAFAMARSEGGELLVLRIQEVPMSLPLGAHFHMDHERGVLEKIEKAAVEKKLNIVTRLIAARSIPDSILETVQMEGGDLLVMGWDGYVNTKGFIFGRKIDAVLHRAQCDLLVVKLFDLQQMKRILIPVAMDENPNLRFTGKVATALAHWFGGEITVVMVVPEHVANLAYARYAAVLEDHIRELKIKTEHAPAPRIVRASHVASALIRESAHYDVVLLPAARGKITKAIGVGSIPEQVLKHCTKTVLIAKGHRGIIQPFFDYIRSRF